MAQSLRSWSLPLASRGVHSAHQGRSLHTDTLSRGVAPPPTLFATSPLLSPLEQAGPCRQALAHKEIVPRKCLILTQAQGVGVGVGQVPQPPTPSGNQVLPSFPCPPPAHLGGQAPLGGCSGLPCSHCQQVQVCAPPEHVAPPRCCWCPGLCRRKEARTRVWLRR